MLRISSVNGMWYCGTGLLFVYPLFGIDRVNAREHRRWSGSPLATRMQSGTSLADVVADAGAHFSAKEKQPINWLSDHLQPHLQYVAALALVL